MKASLITSLFCVLALVACKDKEKSKAESSEGNQIASEELPVTNTGIEVFPVSHATAVLVWDGITIYIDPVGDVDQFKKFNDPDLILITDVHGDHYSRETLEGLETQKAKIIVPQAVADLLPTSFTPQIDVLNNGDTKERFSISIEAIPMYNLREEAKKFHEKGRGNGYVLRKDSTGVYFSGDTEDIPEMRALENIDKAFVCMNLPYTMTVESAADAVLEFKPKEVYPYHYRGRPDVSDVAVFKSLVQKTNPDIKVVQLDWYPNENY